MNQIKDLPPSLFQNLKNLKQLWEPHFILYVANCVVYNPFSAHKSSTVILLRSLSCPILRCYSFCVCADLPSDSLIGWKPLQMKWQALWIIVQHLSISVLLFVCLSVCVCFRNISNNPLAHIYNNQFDSLVNLQSLWVNRINQNISYYINAVY